MTGPARAETAAFPDLRGREVLAVAPLFALLLVLGFFPQTALDVIDDGVGATLAEVGVDDPEPVVPAQAAEGNQP